MLSWPIMTGPYIDPSEYDHCPTPPDWGDEDNDNDGDISVAESPLKKPKTDGKEGGDGSDDESVFYNDEERDRFWDYHKMVMKYQGFHMDPNLVPERCMGKIFAIHLDREDTKEYYKIGVPKAARLAVDFYNARNDKKPKLEYVGIKKANHQMRNLFITFKAKFKDSSSEELRTYQTLVIYSSKHAEVEFVRPEPRHHKIKGEDDWLF
ncbi:uncharacterized protein LOC126679988 isoform X2 [Mercurialis annua]|uniref:uncharacterized protein LOC126679988 isoform X2 n=1 Tax=Mercurialis annua TaxID=3986 RepID=UPI00215F724F|nr:uncharacterized protein LOC126679988 isoform X2 [Mercurialis annua]